MGLFENEHHVTNHPSDVWDLGFLFPVPGNPQRKTIHNLPRTSPHEDSNPTVMVIQQLGNSN